MKIAFVSVRGIPNNYGGFEQFAEYISVGLAKRGHEVTVYSPHYHPYKENEYMGVRIKHVYSPELWMGGSVGSFFYDFKCFKDALKNEHFDIIYEAGYTSIIPAYIWFNVKSRKDVIVTTNMDGLENKRSKFSGITRHFLDWEERMAVKYSHYLVADNMGIHDYYKEKYGVPSRFLAYGADIHDEFDECAPAKYGLKNGWYYLLVARMEPENNVEMAIKGYLASDENKKVNAKPLVVVGKMTTKHGKYLIEKYGNEPNLKFPGGIYDFKTLDSVRYYSYAYFHGHSVGGTNPSLLEAMASRCFIMAHGNQFNRAVLKENALYYNSEQDVSGLINNIEQLQTEHCMTFKEGELRDIRDNYSWEHLVDQHEEYFKWLIDDRGVHRTQNLKDLSIR